MKQENKTQKWKDIEIRARLILCFGILQGRGEIALT